VSDTSRTGVCARPIRLAQHEAFTRAAAFGCV
jgi:hypothetical protein